MAAWVKSELQEHGNSKFPTFPSGSLGAATIFMKKIKKNLSYSELFEIALFATKNKITLFEKDFSNKDWKTLQSLMKIGNDTNS